MFEIQPIIVKNDSTLNLFIDSNYRFLEGYTGDALVDGDYIYLAGAHYSGDGLTAVFKLKLNGELDDSWGINGVATFRTGTQAERLVSIAAENNFIYVAGNTGDGNPFILRLTQDGIIDATFGNNGFKRLCFNNFEALKAVNFPD